MMCHAVLCRATQVVPYLIPSGTEGPGKIKTSTAGQLVVSPSGRYVAVLDRHSCFVWAAGTSATGNRAKPLNLPHTKPYTVCIVLLCHTHQQDCSVLAVSCLRV